MSTGAIRAIWWLYAVEAVGLSLAAIIWQSPWPLAVAIVCVSQMAMLHGRAWGADE